MINLKKIFRQIYVNTIICEIIILGATAVTYYFKANIVTEKITTQKNILNIVNRNSQIEYINKKIRIILEDELFILKTYLNIIDWDLKSSKNDLTEAKDETKNNSWYLNETIFNEYMKGQFYSYNDSCTNDNILHFSKLSEFLKKLFAKHFSWKNKKYVDLEYLYITLKSGCFFKFPSIKSEFADSNYIPVDDKTICADRKKNEYFTPFENETIYDPRCRFFYSTSINSDTKISFTKPYLFTNGKWLGDICIRTELNNGEEKAPDVVLCMVINYYDYEVFREVKIASDTKTELEQYNEIMIMHYKNSNNSENYSKFNVVYDSQYIITELKCNDISDTDCSPINFFDVYYKPVLDGLYEINKNNYNSEYNSLKNSQYKEIESFLLNITSKKKSELLNITLDNYDETQTGNFLYKPDKTIVLKYNSLFYEDYDEKIYMFPILSSYDYKSDYTIVESDSDNFEFYYILIERNYNNNDEKGKFLRVAISEIFLFLFYLLSFNSLIWFIFNFAYYYVIKGLTFSLKQIRKLYLEILTKVTNTNDEFYKNNNKMNLDPTNNEDGKNEEKDDKTWLEYINLFINNYIIKLIHNISQIENHKEIQQSLTTLRAIKIIINYNKELSNINSNTNNENINQENNDLNLGESNDSNNKNNLQYQQSEFIKAIKYLSECFYSVYSNKLTIDFYLVKLIIENIFVSMLKEFNILKKEFLENPKKEKEIVEKLNQIDRYFFQTKQAITYSHNELENVMKNTNEEDNNQDKKQNLLTISLLEENINYLYGTHKCMLLNSIILNKISENFNVGENMDEDEKILVEKLIKKEKKQRKEGNNIGYEYNNNSQRSDNENGNNDADIFDKDNKLKFNFTAIKFTEDFICNEDTKKYIQTIINHCENYLELKENNEKTIKKMSKENTGINLFSNNMSASFKYADHFFKVNRAELFLNKFKEIFILLEISNYHILCDEEQKCIICYESALNKYRDFENLIEKYKNNHKLEWKISNFTMFFINSVFYEKILLIFSFLCHKFAQYRTELFINLNILDFSPLYSLSIRKMVITKIMNFIVNLRNYLASKASDNLLRYKTLITNHNYIDIQRSIYKLICLRNISSKNVKKKVLFLFDLDNKYIKDTVFKEIMFSYFYNYNKEINSNNFEFYFSAFDTKLHLEMEPQFTEDITLGRKYVESYLVVINKNNIQNKLPENNTLVKSDSIVNTSITSSYISSTFITNITSQIKQNRKKPIEISTNINDNNMITNNISNDKIETFFNFIKNYKSNNNIQQNNKNNIHHHRADKALYHAALFGFGGEDDSYNINKKYRGGRSSKKKETSYLVLMTNLSATFTNNKYNWKEMAELLYEKRISVIVVISYDPSYDNDEKLKEKISYYKNFLKSNMIDGHLFIMRSLTLLKFILSSILPIKFSKFNVDILRHYLCSIEDINLAKSSEDRKKRDDKDDNRSKKSYL